MDSLIETYNKIFLKNGYVRISQEELRLPFQIETRLRKYNRKASRKDKVALGKSFKEKYAKIKKLLKKDSPFYKELKELCNLFEVRELCMKNGIRENQVLLKREFIKTEIEKQNKVLNLVIDKN